MKGAGYRKINDRSLGSSKYHKLDGTAVRAILAAEVRTEVREESVAVGAQVVAKARAGGDVAKVADVDGQTGGER